MIIYMPWNRLITVRGLLFSFDFVPPSTTRPWAMLKNQPTKDTKQMFECTHAAIRHVVYLHGDSVVCVGPSDRKKCFLIYRWALRKDFKTMSNLLVVRSQKLIMITFSGGGWFAWWCKNTGHVKFVWNRRMKVWTKCEKKSVENIYELHLMLAMAYYSKWTYYATNHGVWELTFRLYKCQVVYSVD